ncbi:hypothetical protein ABZP36_025772 [Zizania latifolia]
MDMQDDCSYGVDDVAHWFQPLAALPPGPWPPCSWPSPAASSSSSPLVVISWLFVTKRSLIKLGLLLIASDHDGVLDAAGVHGELGMGGCSAADLVLREEEMPGYMPIPATAAAADHCIYQQLQADHLISSSPLPVPADDDELLLLPFTDIDLDSFVDAELIKASPPSLDAAIVPAVSGRHSGTHQNAFNHMELDMSQKRDAARGGSIVHDNSLAMVVDAAMVPAGSGRHSGSHLNACNDMELDMRQQQDAARGGAIVHDDSLSMVVAAAYEMGVRSYAAQKQQSSRPAVMALPPPPPPPPHRVRTGSRDGSAPAAGRTRLDHIRFEDLRTYFYMPITRAAREMNVGLTVLKKRCRELGVARWPHRKMKSLKSLIVNVKARRTLASLGMQLHQLVNYNSCIKPSSMAMTRVQEMGTKGMSSAAIQRELAALETCCAMMEQNPAVELTERTKKLRQACFKENYKRRRAAGAADMLDHCFGFSHHHHQQRQIALPLPLPPSTATGAGNHSHHM